MRGVVYQVEWVDCAITCAIYFSSKLREALAGKRFRMVTQAAKALPLPPLIVDNLIFV